MPERALMSGIPANRKPSSTDSRSGSDSSDTRVSASSVDAARTGSRTPLHVIVTVLLASLVGACAVPVGGESTSPPRSTQVTQPVPVGSENPAPTIASPEPPSPQPPRPPPRAEAFAGGFEPTVPESTVLLPPLPQPYEAPSSEPFADAKTVAALIAQQLLNYDPDTTLSDLAARVALIPAQIPALIEALDQVYHQDYWSRSTVVYPQLGGATDDRISIMIVMRQEFGDGGESVSIETRTLDIRLTKQDNGWVFDELASAGGDSVPRPADLPAIAAEVVDHPDIELPDSARWDIYRGTTTPQLLGIMADLADRMPYGVVVLTTGHPHHVFETDLVSNHTLGRAVDVYRVEGTHVVDDRSEGSTAWDLVRWLCGRGEMASVGSPWVLGDGECRSFTDQVHQDHIHVSVVGSG